MRGSSVGKSPEKRVSRPFGIVESPDGGIASTASGFNRTDEFIASNAWRQYDKQYTSRNWNETQLRRRTSRVCHETINLPSDCAIDFCEAFAYDAFWLSIVLPSTPAKSRLGCVMKTNNTGDVQPLAFRGGTHGGTSLYVILHSRLQVHWVEVSILIIPCDCLVLYCIRGEGVTFPRT